MAMEFFSIFLTVDGMLGKEDLFVIANLSRLMAEKRRNPFRTCEDRLTDGSQLWLRYCNLV